MNTKVDLSKYNNDWYNIGAPTWKIVLWYFVNVLFFLNPLNPFSSLKRFILRFFGSKIGVGVVIKPRVNIKYPWKLTIDDYAWIGEGVWIDNLAEVKIGKNTCLSQGAMLLCGNHDYKTIGFDLIVEPINLEDGVWIGAKSLVTSGVNCYSHSVLSAYSVASKDLDAYSIYRGNPAVYIKDRRMQK